MKKHEIDPNTKAELKKEIDNFFKNFTNGIRAIEAAAKQYVESLDKHPAEADIAYAETFPTLQAKDWKMLAKIGRGELVPRAFLIPNDYAIKCLESLPVHVQNALVGTDTSPAVPQKVYSRGRIVEKTIVEMNAAELTSLVDIKAGKIRKPNVQIMNAANREPKPTAEPWKIVNGVLCVYSRCNFDIEQVAEILAEMRKAVK